MGYGWALTVMPLIQGANASHTASAVCLQSHPKNRLLTSTFLWQLLKFLVP